eukprot:scaffold1949_cov348-Pavlova_lutheri.AAC.5
MEKIFNLPHRLTVLYPSPPNMDRAVSRLPANRLSSLSSTGSARLVIGRPNTPPRFEPLCDAGRRGPGDPLQRRQS